MTRHLYRVKIEITSSVQPGTTVWRTQKVAYCGPDVNEARRFYHTEHPMDFSHGPGCRARVTIFEKLETAELADDDPGDDWQDVT